MEKVWETDSPLEVHSITDSQSSISICERFLKEVGMNKLLKPDMEVAMEIARCIYENKHSAHCKYKVQSHIEELEAPDKIY